MRPAYLRVVDSTRDDAQPDATVGTWRWIVTGRRSGTLRLTLTAPVDEHGAHGYVLVWFPQLDVPVVLTAGQDFTPAPSSTRPIEKARDALDFFAVDAARCSLRDADVPSGLYSIRALSLMGDLADEFQRWSETVNDEAGRDA